MFQLHRITYFPSATWWRHQMETFSALLALCAGNSPVTGDFPSQKPVTLSFDVFFDLRLNKGLSKQTWGWWFETPSRSLWRHCNEAIPYQRPMHCKCTLAESIMLEFWNLQDTCFIGSHEISSAFWWGEHHNDHPSSQTQETHHNDRDSSQTQYIKIQH